MNIPVSIRAPAPHSPSRIEVLQESGRILAAPASADGNALAEILACVCTALDWQYGGCWNEDEQTHHLRCTRLWHEPALAGSDFIARTRSADFTPGVGGLIRATLTSARPFFVADISTLPGLQRAPAALAAGLHSACAFPLLVDGRPLGAMEFFCRDLRPTNEELSAMAVVLGTLVGGISPGGRPRRATATSAGGRRD